MASKIEFFPTSFSKLIINDHKIRHLQVGNIGYKYKLNDLKKKNISLILEIDSNVDIKKINNLFKGSETEYLKNDNKVYYRNCNTVAATKGKEIYYKGKLFNSYLAITWYEKKGKIKVNVHATKQYLIESRSRLTRSSTFDTLLNYLIMHFATYLGYIAFHASAINVKYDKSIVFMGLPNTGKTTTSVSLAKRLSSQLIAEDIVFINKETLRVYSCPFTLNPKSTERFRSDTYIGNKVGALIILNRSEKNSYLSILNNDELFENVSNMNYFEFSWLHDSLIRHMFFQGEANLKLISEKYYIGQKEICDNVNGIELGGKNPALWAELIENYLTDQLI